MGRSVKGWRTQVRSDIAVFEELSEWWDSKRAALDYPSMSTTVLGSWQAGFEEPGSRLSVFLLFRHGELVAAMPLCSARGRHRSLLRGRSEPFDIVRVDDEEVDEYLPLWLESLPAAHLYRVTADSPVVRAVERKPRWSVQRVMTTPFVDLSNGFESVLEKTSNSHRKNLRRCRRRLSEMGTLIYVDHPDPVDVEPALKAGLELQAQGWKGKEGHAVLNNPIHERYYRALAERAEKVGWLRVSSLYLDDRLLSFSFGLRVRGVAQGLLNAYNESPDVRPLSVGTVLFSELFAHAAASGTIRHELGSGSAGWKRGWTQNADKVYDLLLFGSGPRGRLNHGLRSLQRRSGGTQDATDRQTHPDP